MGLSKADADLLKRLDAAMGRVNSARPAAAPPEAPTELAAENERLRRALDIAKEDLSSTRKSLINMMSRLTTERRRWKAVLMKVKRRARLIQKKARGKL